MGFSMQSEAQSQSSSKIVSNEPVFGGHAARRKSHAVDVRWGGQLVTIGGDAPVRVQSMTNTDTADAIGTAIQIKELFITTGICCCAITPRARSRCRSTGSTRAMGATARSATRSSPK